MSGRQTGAVHMFLQGWNLPKGLSSIKSGNSTHKGLEVFHVDLPVYMLFSQGCSIIQKQWSLSTPCVDAAELEKSWFVLYCNNYSSGKAVWT